MVARKHNILDAKSQRCEVPPHYYTGLWATERRQQRLETSNNVGDSCNDFIHEVSVGQTAPPVTLAGINRSYIYLQHFAARATIGMLAPIALSANASSPTSRRVFWCYFGPNNQRG